LENPVGISTTQQGASFIHQPMKAVENRPELQQLRRNGGEVTNDPSLTFVGYGGYPNENYNLALQQQQQKLYTDSFVNKPIQHQQEVKKKKEKRKKKKSRKSSSSSDSSSDSDSDHGSSRRHKSVSFQAENS
jgi:hypothetical protein